MSDLEFPQPAEIESEEALVQQAAQELFGDRLRDDEVGGRVVRGGAVRFVGYGVGSIAVALASVFLLRYLGVAEFGRYATVMSLITIVLGVTDSGLNTVGNRELALRTTADERRHFLGQLLGVRLVLTPIGVLLVLLFAWLAGYDSTLLLGTAVAGLGATLMAVSGSYSLTLAVELKLISLTILDVIKQVTPTIVALILVVIGAALLPFFAMAIPGALIAIALTPWFAGRAAMALPTFHVPQWLPLLKMALPVAVASTIAVLIVRVLTIAMFQFSTDYETGLFSTSVRIVELIVGLSWIVLATVLPVLSIAESEDRERMSFIVQRMLDIGLIASAGLAIALCLAAPFIVPLIGGSAFDAAIPVLQIQAFALVGSFASQALMYAAIASNNTRGLIIANLVGLVSIIAIGIPMIFAWAAQGAAFATVLGELITAAAYWVLVGRTLNTRPHLRDIWKPIIGAAVAYGISRATGLPAAFEAVISLIIFTVLMIITRAIPPEVLDALHPRRIRQIKLGR